MVLLDTSQLHVFGEIQDYLDLITVPIVIWDNNNLIHYCNTSFQKISGFSKYEIEKIKKIDDFICNGYENIDINRNLSQLVTTLFVDRKKNSKNFFIIDNKLNDELNISVIMDSSKKFDSLNYLFNRNHILTNLFESIPDILFVLNKNLIVKFLNYKKQITNLRNEKELINKHISDLGFSDAVIKKFKGQIAKGEKLKKSTILKYKVNIRGKISYFEIRLVLSNDQYVVIVRDITEDHAKEQKRKQLQKKMNNLLENIPMALISVNCDGKILYKNINYKKLLKIANVPDKDNFRTIIGKTNFSNLLDNKELKQFIFGKSIIKIDISEKVDDNSNISYIVLLKDITEDVKNKKIAKDIEKNFQILVETSPNGIAIKTLDEFIYVNKKAKEIFKNETIETFDLNKYFSAEDLQLMRERQLSVLNGINVSYKEYTVNFPDQSQIVIKTKPILIYYNNTNVIQIVFEDISLEKKLQQENFEKRVILEINRNLRNEIDKRLIIEDELKKSVSEKQILLKEIHHRVKNNFQIISSLINDKIILISDIAINQSFKDVIKRIKSMAMVHDFFYKADNFTSINVVDYFQGIYNEYLRNSSTKSAKINTKYTTQLNNIFVGVDESITMGLLFNELFVVSSSINCQNININCKFVELKGMDDQVLCLSISSKFFNKFKTLEDLKNHIDLSIVEIMVEQLNGEEVLDGSVLNLYLKLKLTKTE